MPTIMREGALALPVTYATWHDWRAERSTAATDAPPAPPRPEFCAVCWGQGRIMSGARNGEGLVPAPCGACGGSGRLPAA